MKMLILAAMLFCAGPAVAQVSYDANTRSMVISGTTSDYQAMVARKIFDESEVDTVYLWGPGGLFYAGLHIGRMIAAEGARVIIPAGQTCVSACALAAVAAKQVHVDGELWFHVPFLSMVPAIDWSIDDIARKYGEAYADMTIYLIEMGFTASFAKQLLQETSPCLFMVMKTDEQVIAARGNDYIVERYKKDLCG